MAEKPDFEDCRRIIAPPVVIYQGIHGGSMPEQIHSSGRSGKYRNNCHKEIGIG
jgi:hypothetical protein